MLARGINRTLSTHGEGIGYHFLHFFGITPADGEDGDDESSKDDDDDVDDKDEEAFEDEDDNEEEGHLAPTDFFDILVVDLVLSAGDTEEFKTDESAPIPPSPRSPQIVVPLSQTRLRRARKMIPSPPLPVSSSLLPLPSPAFDSPTYAEVLLGYRATRIRMRAASPPLLLPSTSHRTDITEVGESLAVAAAIQPGPTLEADLRRDRFREMGYGITNT
ncbi:hypothetical protein Tco_1260298 [Tanacetum coccineum]